MQVTIQLEIYTVEDLFLHRFFPSEKAKKKGHSRISEENLTKISIYDKESPKYLEFYLKSVNYN